MLKTAFHSQRGTAVCVVEYTADVQVNIAPAISEGEA